jgi:parvulin-like peptidyl-prolyl isomerase
MPEQVRGIRRKSQKVLERIKEGADFAKMAMEYSEDTSTRKEGGDLGYFKKGELLPALEREASKLQIGEVSGLIRTELGFHILKLLDRKGGEAPPFEEIKEKVEADYYEKEIEKALQQFLSKLKEKSIIEIKLENSKSEYRNPKQSRIKNAKFLKRLNFLFGNLI